MSLPKNFTKPMVFTCPKCNYIGDESHLGCCNCGNPVRWFLWRRQVRGIFREDIGFNCVACGVSSASLSCPNKCGASINEYCLRDAEDKDKWRLGDYFLAAGFLALAWFIGVLIGKITK